MPAYQLHIADQQEIRQEEQRRKELRDELEKCTQVNGTFRNKIYPFLVSSLVFGTDPYRRGADQRE